MKANVLVDSSVWIEFFAGGPKAKKAAEIIGRAQKSAYKTPSLVLFEVYKKIKKELSEQKASEAIAYIIDATEIIPLNERIAVHAAEISLAHSLSMADSVIKATAEITGSEIKTKDSHFKGLENVEII
ncbi:MAG: type II toxin-antitoxin system VapC family toxin [Candidatus Diapherotrites archaeon]